MTNEQILEKAIEKAELNGYEIPSCPCTWSCRECCGHDWWDLEDNLYYAVIFSRDFAKAFWGEGEICANGHPRLECHCDYYYVGMLKAWQYHLQQMALEEDPIKYLEKFI